MRRYFTALLLSSLAASLVASSAAAQSARDTVCVFCAANPGVRAVYAERARAMGEFLARSGRRLVYGGGRNSALSTRRW